MTKAHQRKTYEVRLHNLLGITATSEQVTRIRQGAVDLTHGASWDEVVAWVKDSPTKENKD